MLSNFYNFYTRGADNSCRELATVCVGRGGDLLVADGLSTYSEPVYREQLKSKHTTDTYGYSMTQQPWLSEVTGVLLSKSNNCSNPANKQDLCSL